MNTHTEDNVIEMMNGCICCTVRKDLVEVLKKLKVRVEGGLSLDAIVIETTGMADPAPVAQVGHVIQRERTSKRWGRGGRVSCSSFPRRRAVSIDRSVPFARPRDCRRSLSMTM